MSKKTFYVTTPIYYVNAKPHVGTLYSTLLADVAARWHRFCGEEVFFLTGTDEHGQKIANRAAEEGVSSQDFVDSMVPAFESMWERYAISYDRFIRTTESAHKETVTRWIELLLQKGEIYKGTYEGYYCIPCETFVTPEAKGDEVCPSCQRLVQRITEENYFFKLSAYQDRLLDFYENNPDFIMPKERRNEVISYVKSGLKDLSISRMSAEWGIPFPDDSNHLVYVWGDALMNYLSALGYLQDNDVLFKKYWPANVQVMAKDIIKFHAVYFPAFLMAAEVVPANKLLVHGYIMVDNAKMSKSKGNAFDPGYLADQFGVDQVRYYLSRYMAIAHDGNMSVSDLAHRIGSDLANGLGNLLQRTASIALKYGTTDVVAPATWSDASADLRDACAQMLKKYEVAMNNDNCSAALSELWHFVAAVNAYFHAQQPWAVAKDNMPAFKEIIAAASQSLYVIAHLVEPIMPYKSQQLLAALGHAKRAKKELLWENGWNVRCVLSIPQEPLFVRPEVAEVVEEQAPEVAVAPKQKAPAPQQSETAAPLTITIDDLCKVALVVGEIMACEPMPKSDKLLRMQVNLGAYGQRQILAGVGTFYLPEDLIGKKAIFVANLPARKMMGTESEGMMLFAKDSEHHSLVVVDNSIEPGTRLS